MAVSFALQCLMLFYTTLFLRSTADGTAVYYLRPGTDDQCTPPSLNVTNIINCSEMSRLLMSLNYARGEHNSVELILAPGDYTLAEPDITVNYSLSLIAVEGTATIQCSEHAVPLINNRSTITFNSLYGGDNSTVKFSNVAFQRCKYSLRFEQVENVLIDNCMFRDFLSPSVDILNALRIEINNSLFLNNNVSTANEKFRADAAGLSLSYFSKYSTPLSDNPVIAVNNCTFEDNVGKVPQRLFSAQISQVLNQRFYPARGGALGMIITEQFVNITARFSNCSFRRNYAESFGGAVYIGLDGNGTVHNVAFDGCQFFDNYCDDGGGGAVFIAYLKNQPNDAPSSFVIEDSHFENNTAKSGGGILVLQTRVNGGLDNLRVSKSYFTRNNSTHGSAIVFGSLFNIQSQIGFLPSVIEDCTFTDHNSKGGTVIAGNVHINLEGNIVFSNNTGPTLQIVGCLVQVKGNVSFIGNRNVIAGGAAVYFSAFAQMKLFDTAHVSFIDNTGSLGAAVFVDQQQFPSVYSQLLDNPLCFLLYEDANAPPIDWKPNLIYFSGNEALLGSAIYASYFDLCSHYFNETSATNNIFNVDQFPNWPIFDFKLNYNMLHNDTTNPNYYIQTPAQKIDTNSFDQNSYTLYPGQERTVSVTGLDQFDNPTYFVARVLDRDNSLSATLSSLFNVTSSFVPPANYNNIYDERDVILVVFDPSLVPVYPNTSGDISYSLQLSPSIRDRSGFNYDDITENLQKIILIQIENQDGITSNYVNITLNVSSCLPGYDLQSSPDDTSLVECACIGARDNSFAVLECNSAKEAILLRNGYWASFDNEGAEGQRRNLDVYTCPATYCQCINDSDSCITSFFYANPNSQCHPPRRGALCGSCSDNTTVSVLRMQCRPDCDHNYHIYYGTAILIVGDVIVIVLVLVASVKVSIPFPHSLRAILFYVQTVYIATEYFPISFWNSRQYMLYLSSLIGLYFPVDFCFLSNTSSVLLFLPRFIPPLLVFIVPMFFLCWKRGKRKIWHGVWSLVQVTYAPLCYTCMSILHCPVLADIDGTDDVMRWYLDATVRCFSDVSHIILGVMAIVFLIGLIALIPIVVAMVIFEQHRFFQERYPLLLSVISALKAGYHPNYRWWGGVELIRRLLVIGIVVGLPGRTVAPVYMLAFFFALHIYVQPHKYSVQNVIEAVVLLDYCILFILRFPQSLLESLNRYSGTFVPNGYGSNLPPNDNITFFFWPFFYLPVFIGVGVAITWFVHKIWARRKKSLEAAKEKNIDRPVSTDIDHVIDHNKISYTDLNDLVNPTVHSIQ